MKLKVYSLENIDENEDIIHTNTNNHKYRGARQNPNRLDPQQDTITEIRQRDAENDRQDSKDRQP